VADFWLSAFAMFFMMFFMQSASFPSYQRTLEKGHGRFCSRKFADPGRGVQEGPFRPRSIDRLTRGERSERSSELNDKFADPERHTVVIWRYSP
jgi:hypothetical protein